MDTSSISSIVSFTQARPATAARTADPVPQAPGIAPVVSAADRQEAAGESRQLRVNDSDAPALDLDSAVRQMNDFVQVINRNLQFSVDDTSGRTIVTVVDADSNEIIRQIPPEKVLSLAESMGNGIRGLLLQAEV